MVCRTVGAGCTRWLDQDDMLVTGSLAPGRKEVWCGLEVERELWDGVGSTNSRRASSEFSAVDRQRQSGH